MPRQRQEEPENFGYGVIDEENPAIIDAMNQMIRNGYSDEKVMQVVGVTRSMIERRRTLLESRESQR